MDELLNEKRFTGLILVFDLDQTIIDTHGCIPRTPTGRVDVPRFNAMLDACEADPTGYADLILGQYVNQRLLNEVLAPAARIRDTGWGVSAILLFTNNASQRYVNIVCSYLARVTGSRGDFERIRAVEDPSIPPIRGGAHFFDYVMMRNNPERISLGDVVNKTSIYVRYMLEKMVPPVRGIHSPVTLARRTFFFDDSPVRHNIYWNLFAPNALGEDEPSYTSHYMMIKGAPDAPVSGYVQMGNGELDDTTDYRAITTVLEEIQAGVAPNGFGGGGRRSSRRRRRSRRTSKKRKMAKRRTKKTRRV